MSTQLDMQEDPVGTSVPASVMQHAAQQVHAQHESKLSDSPVNVSPQEASPDSTTSSRKRKRMDSEATDTADMSVGSQAALDGVMPTAASSEPSQSAADHLPSSSAPQASTLSMVKSPSTVSVHKHNHVQQADAGTAQSPNDKTCEDGDVVWRSREQLAACLSCDLCSEVLSDPVTAPECMHSYCRDCIDKHVLYGGTKNQCPVCKKESLDTVLGPQPFQHGKLQFDPMLADMIKKLFPNAEVERGIEERRHAEAKWRASLPVKKPKVAATKPARQKSPAAVKASTSTPVAQPKQGTSLAVDTQDVRKPAVPAVDPKVTLFLQTEEQQRLPLPYLRVNPTLNFGLLASFVGSQLQLNPDLYSVDLYCEGVSLPSVLSVGSVVGQWLQHHEAKEALLINIRILKK